MRCLMGGMEGGCWLVSCQTMSSLCSPLPSLHLAASVSTSTTSHQYTTRLQTRSTQNSISRRAAQESTPPLPISYPGVPHNHTTFPQPLQKATIYRGAAKSTIHEGGGELISPSRLRPPRQIADDRRSGEACIDSFHRGYGTIHRIIPIVISHPAAKSLSRTWLFGG